MTAIAKELDAKLKVWRPATARKVKRLVANIIILAEQDAASAGSQRRRAHPNHDAFLADKKVFRGRATPKDLAANHDDYLYGQK